MLDPVLTHLGHANLTDGSDLFIYRVKQGTASINLEQHFIETLVLRYCGCASAQWVFPLSISSLFPSLLAFRLVFWSMRCFDLHLFIVFTVMLCILRFTPFDSFWKFLIWQWGTLSSCKSVYGIWGFCFYFYGF